MGEFQRRFSKEEIQAGISQLMIHVPSHIITAAKLAGYEVEDWTDEK